MILSVVQSIQHGVISTMPDLTTSSNWTMIMAARECKVGKTYYDRDCAVCLTPFRTDDKATVCCSRPCGNKLSNQRRTQRTIAERTCICEQCGVAFVRGRLSGKALKGLSNEGRFCSKTCQDASLRKPRPAPWVPDQRDCAQCGSPFMPHRPSQEVCSAPCRTLRSALLADQVDRSPRPCGECGVVFAPTEYGDKRRLFCSKVCGHRQAKRIAKAARRARMRSLPRETVDPLVVFRRDDWHCHICGATTPMALRGTHHDRAPELDHIVPLSAGGAHTYANTACSCRACNHAKGELTLDEYLIARSGSKGVGPSKLPDPGSATAVGLSFHVRQSISGTS